NSYTFTYGASEQRKKMVLSQRSGTTTTYYFSKNEVEINGTLTRQLSYISAGNGLAAIHVKRSDGTDTLYYVHKDHLGSIMALTNDKNTTVAMQNFDAWGRYRNPNTWAYSTQRITVINRGYTGHEHLTACNLINMNGRVYDPLLGMFLSPDNYVQSPTSTQNFNRYAYCINNPLKYTDPDGEFFITGTALILAAIIGGSINLISQGMQGNIHNGIDAFKAFGIGAGVGALSAFGGAAVLAGVTHAGIAVGSFVGGSLSGATSGFIGGFGSGTLNSKIMEGNSWDASFSKGVHNGIVGAIAGGAIGGVLGGASALKDGRRFWTGTNKCDYGINLNKGNPYLIKTKWGKEAVSDTKWIDVKDFDNMETNINQNLQDGTYKVTWNINEGTGVRTIVSNSEYDNIVGGTANRDLDILKGGWKIVSGKNINIRTEMLNGTNYNLSIDKLIHFTNYRSVFRGFYFAW
ncbi:MAG TPA: hypothetical protein DCY97_04585, partial [Marinilabiliales bacterium]|nr:hypothetical protein [Marinilabiliales bacterium]